MGTFTNNANFVPNQPALPDYYSENEGDDISYGYRLGVIYSPSPDTRIGLTYHAKVETTLEGDSELSGGLQGAASGLDGSNFETDIILPAYWDLGLYHRINDRWEVMASAIYTEWEEVEEFRLKNVVGASVDLIDVVIPQNYENTWNFSVGAGYQLNNKWKLKAGLGYDMTPTNDEDRVVNVPDEDRVVTTIGADYKWSENMTISASYAHIFVKEADVSATTNINNTLQTATGSVKTSADVLGLQVNYTF
jgi:long-chain fatty acid transport protein